MIAADSAGRLFVTDSPNNAIRVLLPGNEVLTISAGGVQNFGRDYNGPDPPGAKAPAHPAQPASRRQVLDREIELEKQLVAEELQRLAVGDQTRHIGLHHGDLRVRTELQDGTVAELGALSARQLQADMMGLAPPAAGDRAHVRRPPPPGVLDDPSDDLVADVDQILFDARQTHRLVRSAQVLGSRNRHRRRVEPVWPTGQGPHASVRAMPHEHRHWPA